MNSGRARVVMAGLALSITLATLDRGWAQAAPVLGVQPGAQQPLPAEPPPQQIAPAAAPAERENPGLINEIGKLFKQSGTPSQASPGETVNVLPNIARPSSMVSGRTACVVASNGAPDCKLGADLLCQSKGFKEGRSLDISTTEKCSPLVYLPGHKRGPNDCKAENFVTRALCQ
ncbi:hypothetical protein JQ633_07465 [Bradyrhizobium tropiciagri]|nr:hypothetical protein [Bradyrhizobium tropiciagri]